MNHDTTQSFEELTASACWRLVRGVAVGRIALHGEDDEIEIFPINFIVDHGSVVFKTAQGTKLSLAHQRGRAVFEVDAFDFYEGTAWSVVMRGAPRVLERHDDVVEAFDLEIRSWHTGSKPTFVRLAPDVMTGRRFRIDPAAATTA